MAVGVHVEVPVADELVLVVAVDVEELEPDAVPDEVPEPLPVAVTHAVALGLPVRELVPDVVDEVVPPSLIVATAEPLDMADGVAVRLLERVCEVVLDGDVESEPVLLPVLLLTPVHVPVPVCEGVAVELCVPVLVAHREDEGVPLLEAVSVPLPVDEDERVPVLLPERLLTPVKEEVPVCEGVDVELRVPVLVAHRVDEVVPLLEAVCVPLPVAEDERVPVALPVWVPAAVAQPLPDRVAVALPLRDAALDAEAHCVGLPLLERVCDVVLDGDVESVPVLLPVRLPAPVKVPVPVCEGVEVELRVAVLVEHSVDEDVPLPVFEGTPVAEPLIDRVPVALPEGVAVAVVRALAVPLAVLAALLEGVAVAVVRALAVPLAVADGVQDGSAMDPATQSGEQTQGVHVALEAAPTTGENFPTGHSVGFTEERGQKEPAGQMAGAPEEQKYPAGQGTQVSWRMRCPLLSATYKAPDGEADSLTGLENIAATPKASLNPPTPEPATVCTWAVVTLIERMRCPESSAT